MILTPKNWKSFQHYKDRAPSWIKLHKALLDNFEFACLPIASKALAPMLWLLASEYDDGKIEASIDALAFRLRMTRGDFAAALNPLVQSGFFDTSEMLAEPEQNASLEKEDIGKKKRKEDTRAASPSNEDFENLKKVYPKRAGNYGWKAAERKFNSLVKTGVDPKTIIAAAVRLGETLRSKVGTEFIPMPASWLNSEDFVESATAAFLAAVPIKGFYAGADSPQLEAWDLYRLATTGKRLPRDRSFGWRVDSEWPPGHVPIIEQKPEPVVAPLMRAMQ